ncbi:hypothetical protein ACJOMK_05750, partial [Mycoplasmopsis synoviae]
SSPVAAFSASHWGLSSVSKIVIEETVDAKAALRALWSGGDSQSSTRSSVRVASLTVVEVDSSVVESLWVAGAGWAGAFLYF